MRRYHPVLTAAAIRVSLQRGRGTRDEIDDIIQEIYCHICKDDARVLTGFRDPRPEAMFGYLKVVATNAAHDFFRRSAGIDAEMTASFDEAAGIPGRFEDLDRRLSLLEIEEMLLALTKDKDNGSRDRTVFRLYYFQGWTTRAIAELPGVRLNSKGVEGVVHRLTKAIRQAFAGV